MVLRLETAFRTAILCAALSAFVHAPQRAAAQGAVAIPVQELTPVSRTTERLGLVLGVRALSNGDVLINDAGQRRVLLFDSRLQAGRVVIDSASGSPNSYGPRATPLIAYLGDSTLFVDVRSQSLIVLDPAGRIARAIAAPKPQELALLSQTSSGIDPRGRLVYRGVWRAEQAALASGFSGVAATSDASTGASRDSSPIVRADFQSRTVDTVARVKMPVISPMHVVEGANGRRVGKVVVNLLQIIDDWAVTADGSVAIVRGLDYRVEWIGTDGRVTTSKLPFDWRKLSDADKQQLIDSARTADSVRASAPDLRGATPPGRIGLILDGQAVVRETEYVPISEMPDYYPSIRVGAVRADMDGNIWILPTTTTQSRVGELVYDVVNRQGTLVKRVRLPAGRSIAGFARGSVVFLLAGDKTTGFSIERATLR